jgi:hypothetical protein
MPFEACEDWRMGPDGDDESTASADTSEEQGEGQVEGPESQDASLQRFDRWRNESAIGGIGTGIARGLQSVFGTPQQEIAIVAEVPGEPPDADKRLRVILDPDDPTKSIAVVPATPADSRPADPPPT